MKMFTENDIKRIEGLLTAKWASNIGCVPGRDYLILSFDYKGPCILGIPQSDSVEATLKFLPAYLADIDAGQN